MDNEEVKIEEKYWFVGRVRSKQDFKVMEALTKLSVECYVPYQTVQHRWSDRLKKIKKLLTPGMVFIHATQKERIPLLSDVYGLVGYTISKATHTPIVVPQQQMDVFMQMVSQNEREITVLPTFAAGDNVLILSGPLCGLKCKLLRMSGKKWFAINLEGLCTAAIEVSTDQLEKIE